MKLSALIFFLLLLITFDSYGSNGRLDSLYKTGTKNLYDGNFDEAFNNFYERRNLSEQLKDSVTLAQSIRYLGEVCRATRQFDLALMYLNQALAMSDAIYDSLGMAKCYNRISAVKFEQKDVDGTLDFGFKALRLSDHLGDKENSANTLNIIGAIYTSTNQYAIAINYYGRAREAMLTLKDQSDLPNILNNIANNYFLLGDYSRGLPYAEESFQLASKNHTLVYMLEAARELSQEYKGLGQYQKALQFNEKADSINELYTAELKKAEKTAINLKYQNEITIKENTLLKTINEETQRLLKTQRIIFWVTVAGLVSVSGLLIMLLIYYRQRKKNLQMLREQNVMMENQKRELQELNTLKDTLLTVISHDFRAPLVTLHSMMQLLDMGVHSPEELVGITGGLKKHINRSIEALDNIIFWSRTQMQGFKLNKEVFDLRNFSEEVFQNFQNELKSKQLAVENNVPENNSISSDREVLRIILRNLISNSIKFSHPGGIISLFDGKENGQVKISLKDHGTGISNKIIDKLLSQEHITTLGTQNEKGTGMGLILTRELVKKLEGTIDIQSETGLGSTFTILIPA